jgi:hypothetical protein
MAGTLDSGFGRYLALTGTALALRKSPVAHRRKSSEEDNYGN